MPVALVSRFPHQRALRPGRAWAVALAPPIVFRFPHQGGSGGLRRPGCAVESAEALPEPDDVPAIGVRRWWTPPLQVGPREGMRPSGTPTSPVSRFVKLLVLRPMITLRSPQRGCERLWRYLKAGRSSRKPKAREPIRQGALGLSVQPAVVPGSRDPFESEISRWPVRVIVELRTVRLYSHQAPSGKAPAPSVESPQHSASSAPAYPWRCAGPTRKVPQVPAASVRDFLVRLTVPTRYVWVPTPSPVKSGSVGVGFPLIQHAVSFVSHGRVRGGTGC